MKNLSLILVPILLILLCFGCDKQIKKQEGASVPMETNTSSLASEDLDNKKWVAYYNSQSDSLAGLYDESAIKILSNGECINGRAQIGEYYLKDVVKVISVITDTIILANEQRGISYEINESILENNDRYKNMVISLSENQERKRVLEFSAKISEAEIRLAEIDQRRNLWMRLCNEHNAQVLINECYTDNTIYYNHKPIVKGRARVIEEYQYMNDEQYELALRPEVVDVINDQFVFEIGQCSGSYNGKYILIWRKDEDGMWRVFIDSNI